MTVKDRGNKIILRLQEMKKPHDEARQELWDELHALLAKYKPKEDVIRKKIKDAHGKCRPYDKLMSVIADAKRMKNEKVAMKALDAVEEEISNGEL